ncbi:hypothetical protein Ate02nite_50880 [Paractinoplanes tereljensis]|uniref:Uncharacterized protein n=1 Tax=Paractinoplanes tereljensis TaxID=571912 RepID=A0A919NPM1_9ACTN|nr:hypothetical protein Ate02nite_50880 [Actinoplanes tereljensis]
MLFLSACRTDDTPSAPETPAAGAAAATTEAATTEAATTGPAEADLRCLVAGSPWHVSKPDLESQFRGIMRGIDVTDVHIAGDQILTVGSDLGVRISDRTTTTVTVDMSGGLTMVMTQKHTGDTAGRWEADGNALRPVGAWTGGIDVDTKVAINGRTANSPVSMPGTTLGNIPMTFTCADGSLNLTVTGSPFVYLFR